MTAADLLRIRDAMSGLRHHATAVEQVAQHHRDTGTHAATLAKAAANLQTAITTALETLERVDP
jgi:siroheme synthase